MIRKEIKIFNETISYLSEDIDINKPILLFVHGFSDEAARVISLYRLERNYNLFALDLPGCGKSSNHIKEPTLEYYSQIVSEFIKKMFGNKFIYLLSHSMGSVPSLFAGLNNNINKIIMCAPLNYYLIDDKKHYLELLNWLLPNNSEEFYESQLNLLSDYDNAKFLEKSVKDNILKIDNEVLNLRKRKFNKIVTQQILNQEYVNKKIKPLFDKNNCFTIVFAKQDKYVLEKEIQKIIKEQNCDFVEINECGHAMFYKKYKEINNIINNIINNDRSKNV
ncbi:alpha/beta fold hydrolase [Mycoplasmopsis lipofaciens]|uniref:alpha/beta fold hydrolase n=1 Tax=Mycoplasmopsis lipofaciens TaxID=114884 RepID=UPI000488BA73|nr:alpha/beta fold hydrolase [Mycoplasmopsis lipofaciens]